MTTGDAQDMQARIRRLLPSRWFADSSPVLDAVLSGGASMLSFLYAGVAYVSRQTRLLTATESGLDAFAFDYLGSRIARRAGESDDLFRIRVKREILRHKVTRQSLSDNLFELTGHRPRIFEPALTTDTSGWNRAPLAFNNGTGRWGSRRLPYQAFVTAYRPPADGPPGVSGFNDSPGGWGAGRFELQSRASIQGGVTDEVIREAVVSTIACGTVVWLNIKSYEDASKSGLDIDFALDVSPLD